MHYADVTIPSNLQVYISEVCVSVPYDLDVASAMIYQLSQSDTKTKQSQSFFIENLFVFK